jgi:hypothetical protein
LPTPTIVASTRFMDIGVTKVYYLPAIAASTLVPTRAEMNGGTNLTGEISDWAGWVLDSEFLDVQPMNSPYKSTIPGSLSSPASSLTFYTSKTGGDVRTVFSRGVTGFIMILDGGDVSGNRAEVYPVTVASVSVVRGIVGTSGGSTGTDVASQVRVGFAIIAAPAQNVTVPA